ncbi:hypothetical protein [Streptomyces sp. 7N604]|uniref:hypothetical protein n=1 Tax=Streptomyces sp. 7N604 TaxID=3457415 RepID=UPI003FD2CBE4
MPEPEPDPRRTTLLEQLHAEILAARAAGTPLGIEHTEALHLQVHASFLKALPPNTLRPVEPPTVWCTAQLPDDVYWRSQAVHEAAHAVLSLTLGLRVRRLLLARDRTLAEGGGCLVEPPGNAQHFALEKLGAAHAQAIWLDANDYDHRELRRCVLEVAAAGDRAVVDSYEAEGFVIDRKRAVADAVWLLSTPGTMTAIETVADRLATVHELDGRQVSSIIDQHRPVRPPVSTVWIPGPRDILGDPLSGGSARPSADQTGLGPGGVPRPGRGPGASARLNNLLSQLEAGRETRERLLRHVPSVSTPHQQQSHHAPHHRQQHGHQPGAAGLA